MCFRNNHFKLHHEVREELPTFNLPSPTQKNISILFFCPAPTPLTRLFPLSLMFFFLQADISYRILWRFHDSIASSSLAHINTLHVRLAEHLILLTHAPPSALDPPPLTGYLTPSSPSLTPMGPSRRSCLTSSATLSTSRPRSRDATLPKSTTTKQ
jgi:hypothetical protein